MVIRADVFYRMLVPHLPNDSTPDSLPALIREKCSFERWNLMTGLAPCSVSIIRSPSGLCEGVSIFHRIRRVFYSLRWRVHQVGTEGERIELHMKCLGDESIEKRVFYRHHAVMEGSHNDQEDIRDILKS